MVEIANALGEMVRRRAADRAIVGLAVAVGSHGEPDTFWVPSAPAEEPGFLAYSITKTFTAALMLMLQEEGRLNLDDPLASWLAEVPGSREISLRQLLNHTAGIPDYGGLRSYHEAVRKAASQPWSYDRFAAETFEKGLLFEPGTGWAYSNPGYMLLKRVAEHTAGQTYATLILNRIAEPLGLRRTFLAETPGDLSSLASASSAFLTPDGRHQDVRQGYHPGWVSHGVLATTPSEVARFFGALFSGGLLSAQSLREMTELVPVPNGPPHWRKPSYGLGLMGDPESPWGVLWGHNGGGPGYSTSAFHAPNLQGRTVTVCAMCAIEEDSLAEDLVLAALELARGA